ncbi:V-type proton ATPase 16 kDa proteolipid [Musa troglodytarum]|uniref:V-type proton ATPase proteolipid subunit n=1 Tax=Musa troglodytarum TaxID=320322 RepID=A0A9E7FVM2_9LILI|nr:V-type proton ATPase 16 kDa proteolipid [Musa troglodytarum]
MSTFSGDETAPFFGFLGAAAALVFSCMGAAYGTAKSGVGVASMGVMRPELVMKSIVPVVMAGVLGIYGLIIAVIISTGINPKAKSYYLFDGYAHLSSGLACGLAGLSAGMAIGIVGDAGVRANAQQPKLFVGMILILIFAEALALYGLIVGIILSSRAVRAHNPQLLSYYLGAPSEREMTLGTLTLEKKRKLDDSDQYLDLSSDTSILFFGNILHCNFTALKVTVQFLSGTKQLCNCSKSRSQSQGYY